MPPKRDPSAPIVCPFTVLIDTREQAPYSFGGMKADAAQKNRPLSIPTRWQGLDTGDYSIDGFQSLLCIERKSPADLFGTLGRGRERFEREHERMAKIVARGGFAAVVVESTLEELIAHPPEHSRLNPKTVFRTWLAWELRYRVRWLFLPDRRWAEMTTFRLLERFWKDDQERKKEAGRAFVSDAIEVEKLGRKFLTLEDV